MYDQSFNENSLDREIRKSDFRKHRTLHDEQHRKKHVMDACERVKLGFKEHNALKISVIQGKPVSKITKFADELVLRKLNANIIKLCKTRTSDRDSIVSNIEVLLAEGIQYRVFRLDIKSFYESIPKLEILNRIERVKLLSLPTKRHLFDLIQRYHDDGHKGMPRGLSVSATISELVLSDFDKAVSAHREVFFFSRYVDDMIIITSGNENRRKFVKWIRSVLPDGLILNDKKQLIRERARVVKEKGGPPLAITTNNPSISFEFLGYNFKVTDPTGGDAKKPRQVDLDIAPTKVNKIKTRIANSLIAYSKDKDFELLVDRVSFLCSNFSVVDADRDRKRLAGIYHNYHRVISNKSEALVDLDKYLMKIITSGFGNVSDAFFTNTSLSQRRQLLQWSFFRGHSKKIYIHFSEPRLSEIQRCWKYVK